MEAGRWPELEIVRPIDRLKTIARTIGRVLSPLPSEAPDFMSNHYRKPTEPVAVTQPDLWTEQ